jgi:RNA polymerase sigma-70 factor (ECF subfamily)
MYSRETPTESLLRNWHQGDSKSLEALVERHLPWIQKQVRRRMGPVLRSKGDTGDYLHDAMVEFLRYGPRFLVRNEFHFRALVLKVVENSLRQKHRWFMAARRQIAQEKPFSATTTLTLDRACVIDKTPSQSAERHEREAWIRLAMEFLEPDDREILVLRQWQKLPFVEIARRKGISSHAATMRHHRAIRHLAAKAGELRRQGLSSILEEISP